MKKTTLINTLELDGYLDSWEVDDLEYELGQYLDDMDDHERDVKITGTLGLWDGSHEIETVKEPTFQAAVNRCIQHCDDFVVTATGRHTVHVDAYHHDGVNHFKITQY